MKQKPVSVIACSAVAIAVALGAIVVRPQDQVAAARAAALTDLVLSDPALTTGTLSNGLRYYIRVNKTPAHVAELRLVVRAGSVLETDKQQGLAHFVEHMAFDGTTHFPRQSLLAFFSRVGLGIGADVNAQTGYDETTYKLRIPTGDPRALDTAFLILEDWAHGISFDRAAVDRERLVVLEEWRQQLGAATRIRAEESPILFKGSPYANRAPIGQPDVIRRATPGDLKKFYNAWYRPDLMAVVAAGDIDAAAVQSLIAGHFAALPRRTSPKRPVFDVPDHPGTIYTTAVDKERTSTTVTVENLQPRADESTVGAYRQILIDRLFAAMLTERLARVSRQPDAPFALAAVSHGLFTARTKDQSSIAAVVNDGGVARALQAVLTEVARVSRFGFTPEELRDDVQNQLAAADRLLAGKDARTSANAADECVRNFLVGEPVTAVDYEHALAERFLPATTLDDVNRLARAWFPDVNRFVIVAAPDKPGVALPDAAALEAAVRAVDALPLSPPVERVAAAGPLIDTLPAPGRIVETSDADDAGIVEWALSNGARVILRPSSSGADEVVFRATRSGGTSLASDADYPAANASAQVVGAGGVGAFSADDLRRVLAGKTATVAPFVNELDEGLAGGAAPKDLETLFQLIYLRFTAPRIDPAAYRTLADQLKSVLANETASPNFQFRQALMSALGQDSPRRRLPTPDDVDRWNLDASLAFYRARFDGAGQFTFIFAGRFDLDAMRPLVERYLASLPAGDRRETWKDTGVRPPAGVVERVVKKGIEPRSEVALVFTGPIVFDDAHRVALKATASVLQSILFTNVRQALGGTYTIRVVSAAQKIPVPSYTVTIQWGCDPARVDETTARVLEAIASLKANRLSEASIGIIRTGLDREFQTEIQQNSYWVAQLSSEVVNGVPLDDLWTVRDAYRTVDAAAIQQGATTYLDTARYVKVTLLPEP